MADTPMVEPHDRGTAGQRPGGNVDPRGGEVRRRARAALLLPPGTSGRRRVPHVPRRSREGAEARAVVRDVGRRRAGRARALGEGARGAQGRARDAAHQPSARLPDLRSGRRVRAAGLHVPGRARRGTLSRPEALQSGRGLRRRRDVHAEPLHPLHAVRAVHGRRRARSGAQRQRARRSRRASASSRGRTSRTRGRATSSISARWARCSPRTR